MDMELEAGALYRHCKGGSYKIVGVARHSETLEEMVIYAESESPKNLWARPKGMFLDYVERDGVKVRRFEPISKK